mmetsp:Transcript_15361/g.13087  ORF Transcript_15361/g.13087 Transcript_15361/m.13087 type:complete len:336 (+) Transcript_15361:434-1441(+)|eukprot:CAMPEP_0114587058 /NCGR_PEP_ID=MMETSP0125-20121206/10121_1 /TAXON_ID=485358 ORGANISM="Aristerostoma sp., Strain ATCC 50986" /NCGR_SAMPLE_ID=MMETSP0125 /ASSEMBLY_ACC=CAM_ASM_000245 /LENGTH=335 /DNA_ID=CAMNT_0001782795 /DNA_START=434 /DNA_END=1441 /DNA_ORIENTATION=-
MFMLGFEFLVFYLVFTPVVYGWFYTAVGIITIYIANANKVYNLPGRDDTEIVINCLFVLGSFTFLTFMFERGRRSAYQLRHELAQKERIWKEVLDIFPEATLLIDKNKEIKFANKAFRQLSSSGKRGVMGTKADDLEMIKSVVFDDAPKVIRSESQKVRPVLTRKYTKFHKIVCDEAEIIQEMCETKDLIQLFNYMKYNWKDMYKHFVQSDKDNSTPDFIIYQGKMTTDDGEERFMEMKFSMKQFEYEANALIIFSDLGEKFKVQSLNETIQYKNRLLASVSHELRTPLNGNINFIQTAVDDPYVPENVKDKLLSPAIKSAKYLLTLINDILDFS